MVVNEHVTTGNCEKYDNLYKAGGIGKVQRVIRLMALKRKLAVVVCFLEFRQCWNLPQVLDLLS